MLRNEDGSERPSTVNKIQAEPSPITKAFWDKLDDSEKQATLMLANAYREYPFMVRAVFYYCQNGVFK